MKFPGAPYGLKMACGENPKRVYGEKGRAPSTRMGNVAGYRRAWIEAAEYRRQWDEHRERQSKKKEGDDKGAGMDRTPVRDLEKETLAGVLAGEILVQNHCYRADEMLTMIDIAREFGYKISAFHHAIEAYKIADVLAAKGSAPTSGPTGGASRWRPSTASARTPRSWSRRPAPAPSSTPTPPRASSGSTRKPPRPWPPATAWA